MRNLLAKGSVFINWLALYVKTGYFGCGRIVAISIDRERNIHWCEEFTIVKELAFRRKACLSGKLRKCANSRQAGSLAWGMTCPSLLPPFPMNDCKEGAGETKVKLLEAIGCIGVHAFYRGSAPSLEAIPSASTKQNFIQIHQVGSCGIG